MDLHELKLKLQGHLTDGLAVIVGSGLPAAEGLPTMPELATHLLEVGASDVPKDAKRQWEGLAAKLRSGTDLESALREIEIDQKLEAHIIKHVHYFISQRECLLFAKIAKEQIDLSLTKLITHLILTSKAIPIITTNYDRMIELSAEIIGIAVDTMFVGQVFGQFDPKLSREALWLGKQTQKRTSIKREFRPHVRLFKPHGSLDWFLYNGQPIRCPIQIDAPRLMITPGATKYIRGYDQPFDRHREAANREIDKAARFLVIGYGFNDQQLETHLRPRLHSGVPCLILTKNLTPNARSIVEEFSSVLALTAGDEENQTRTRLTTSESTVLFEGTSLWNLNHFVSEVLAP